jgi:hypothetical protein
VEGLPTTGKVASPVNTSEIIRNEPGDSPWKSHYRASSQYGEGLSLIFAGLNNSDVAKFIASAFDDFSAISKLDAPVATYQK